MQKIKKGEIDVTNFPKKVYVKPYMFDGELGEADHDFIRIACGVNPEGKKYVFDIKNAITIGIKMGEGTKQFGYWQYFPKECVPEIIKQLSKIK